MIEHRYWDIFLRPRFPIACHGTGLEIAAFASLAMTAGSTIMGAIGQGQKAAADAAQMNYQAQVARNNQMVAEWNAQRALQQGDVAAEQKSLQAAQLRGAQRAALAAQGGDVNSGSPLDIQGDTARAGEFDRQTIRSNAAQQAYNYRLQGAGYGAQAGLYNMGAANTMASLPFGIGSSLLGGAGSIADKWPRYKDLFNAGAGAGSYLDYGGVPGPAW